MGKEQSRPGMLPAMFTMKCPSCRKTHVFIHKSMFPMNQLVELKEECEVCG